MGICTEISSENILIVALKHLNVGNFWLNYSTIVKGNTGRKDAYHPSKYSTHNFEIRFYLVSLIKLDVRRCCISYPYCIEVSINPFAVLLFFIQRNGAQ